MTRIIKRGVTIAILAGLGYMGYKKMHHGYPLQAAPGGVPPSG